MKQTTYVVEGMDCANCARDLEKGIDNLVGVQTAQVDFLSKKLTILGNVSVAVVQERAAALGFTASEMTAVSRSPKTSENVSGGVIGFIRYLLGQANTRLALAGGGLILLAAVGALLGLPQAVVNGGYVIALFVALYPIARSGLNNLFINRDFNINLLMTIAALGAVLIGEYVEGATVIFLFAIGEALEGHTTNRARNSLRALMQLAPPQAVLLTEGRELIVPVEQLAVGDVIVIKPAERVPMDGLVLSGESSLDQSPITGESVPVYKAEGSEVFAGSVNGEGLLHVRVTRLEADNTLSRIIQLVEQAQSQRAPSQRMIDQFARYYTPAMALLALGLALVPPLLFGAPFWDTADTHGWFYRALTVLVIACPCALVISTPVTVISAITAAARRGVLIKGGAHLEALAGVRVFAFDKTGTLTRGEPQVQGYRSADCTDGLPCADCDDVLVLASSVEQGSTHPLARAVLRQAEKQQLAYPTAEGVRTLTGRGVQGYVNGQLVTVGSHTLFDLEYPHTEDFCALVQKAEDDGQTTILVANEHRVKGFIAVADALRADSPQVIAELKQMKMRTVMLTGDNDVVAQSIARDTGIDDFRAGLLPQDKVTAVRDLLTEYGHVAMVGDGINDTPALAAATVGIAMGGAGTAQALETADVALMADDLRGLPFAVRLARFARGIIRQNIILSLATKAIFLLLAPVGSVSLWAAIFADVGVSLLVALNGMRPLRFEQQAK